MSEECVLVGSLKGFLYCAGVALTLSVSGAWLIDRVVSFFEDWMRRHKL